MSRSCLQSTPGFLVLTTVGLLLLTPLRAWADSARSPCAVFAATSGGYQISTAFDVDAERHAVISPPTCLGNDDLLSIRPLRLNPDDYLILQKCSAQDCSKSEVVRAWNTFGPMGPYPVLTKNIRVERGVRYMLWLQNSPVPGNHTYALIDRYAPPLVFKPVGALTDSTQRSLKAAAERGPAPVKKSTQRGSDFVVTFKGGSVVWMQALRPEQ
jgi:hypothetical protein